MATIQQHIKAAKDAGYTVIENAPGRFAYNAPNGNGAGTGYHDQIDAWAAAAEHYKKNKKAFEADKFAILGLHVYRRNGASLNDNIAHNWKPVAITAETPTTVTVEGKNIGYYDKRRPKAEILKRFPTLEDAEAFKAQALAATAAEDKALIEAEEAAKLAKEKVDAARRARALAVRAWAMANVEGLQG